MHQVESTEARRDGARARTYLRRTCRGLALTLTLALLALVATLALLPAFGYERLSTTDSSMAGSIEEGSIALTRQVPVRQLAVGDVIAYTPPEAASGPLTHRITWVGRDSRGLRAFRTKGDANAARDPWTFNLENRTQARVEHSLPLVGYAMAGMTDPGARAFALLLFALLVVGRPLRRLWREAGPTSGRHGGTPALTPSPEKV